MSLLVPILIKCLLIEDMVRAFFGEIDWNMNHDKNEKNKITVINWISYDWSI